MYIHSKLDYKKNILIYFLTLVPLIIYGVYKNGYLLYQKNLISIYEVFKPIYLLLICFLLYEIISLIKNRKIVFDNDLISCLIISLIVPPMISYLYFTIGITIFLIINVFLKDRIVYNKIAFGKLLIVLILVLFSKYGYYNALELNYNYSFNIMDYITGRQIGSISSTSIILMIVGYVILSLFAVYKKNIPIISYIVYLIGCIIYSLLINRLDITTYFNASIIFAFIYVATDSKSSPYMFKKSIFYGIIIGILTLVFSSIINVYEGVYISILITSILFGLLNKHKNVGIFDKNRV